MVNNTDVEALNSGCQPKLEINCKLFPQIWLIGMLFQDQQRCRSRNMLHLVKSGSSCVHVQLLNLWEF